METKIIYEDLIKMLKKVKNEKDLSHELASTLLIAFIDVSNKTLIKEQKDLETIDALQITRINSLQMFDEFIFNERLKDLEDY